MPGAVIHTRPYLSLFLPAPRQPLAPVLILPAVLSTLKGKADAARLTQAQQAEAKAKKEAKVERRRQAWVEEKAREGARRKAQSDRDKAMNKPEGKATVAVTDATEAPGFDALIADFFRASSMVPFYPSLSSPIPIPIPPPPGPRPPFPHAL